MSLPSLLVGLLPDGTDPIGLAVVALIGRHILDAAMPVLSVVPVDKAFHPGFHREQIPESPERITLVVLTARRDCVYIVRNHDSA